MTMLLSIKRLSCSFNYYVYIGYPILGFLFFLLVGGGGAGGRTHGRLNRPSRLLDFSPPSVFDFPFRMSGDVTLPFPLSRWFCTLKLL